MSQLTELIKLSELPHGASAHLADIRGGRQLTRRLLALGLRQGSVLQIVQRRGQGLVLAIGEVRIAVGAGIADKLWVAPNAPAVMESSDPPTPLLETNSL
ncbi:FeoA family protein [Chromatium okenii]|uniref:FeoA family protein n=1 Tax=Chromatium okenii TaxID=61644 RepID=UPI0026EA8B55|nr:FeoA family protein [Chromatium okenii]MBV5308892.1 ferrous iron transport protein A [Chromatium okenii]